MRQINEPTLNPGIPISQALDSNGETLLVGDIVKLTGNHHRPEFFEGGSYQVTGLFTYTDESHPGQDRQVTTAQLMKINSHGNLLHWSWKTSQWQEMVDLDEPAIYADTTLLEKFYEKEGATLEKLA